MNRVEEELIEKLKTLAQLEQDLEEHPEADMQLAVERRGCMEEIEEVGRPYAEEIPLWQTHRTDSHPPEPDVVTGLREAHANGADVPPTLVLQIGKEMFHIVDGHHRTQAAKEEGRSTGLSIVLEQDEEGEYLPRGRFITGREARNAVANAGRPEGTAAAETLVSRWSRTRMEARAMREPHRNEERFAQAYKHEFWEQARRIAATAAVDGGNMAHQTRKWLKREEGCAEREAAAQKEREANWERWRENAGGIGV